MTRPACLAILLVLASCAVPADTQEPEGPAESPKAAEADPAEPMAASPPTHCGAGELPIFNCVIEKPGEPVLSVCASEPLGQGGGHVQYRFGPPGNVELEYPEKRERSYDAFKYSRYTRYQTTHLRLRFSIADHEYTIIDDAVEGQTYAGVDVVLPDGGKVRLRCRGTAEGSLMKLEGLVPSAR